MIKKIEILEEQIKNLEEIIIKQTEEKYLEGEFTGVKKEEYENNIGDLLTLKNEVKMLKEKESLDLFDEYSDLIYQLKENNFTSKNAIILYNIFQQFLEKYYEENYKGNKNKRERIDHILNKINITI